MARTLLSLPAFPLVKIVCAGSVTYRKNGITNHGKLSIAAETVAMFYFHLGITPVAVFYL